MLKKEQTIEKLTRQTIGGQSTLLKFLQNILNEDRDDIRHIELTYFSLSVTTFFYLQFGGEEDKKELLDEVNHTVFSKSIPALQEDLRLEQAQNEYELRLEEYSNLIVDLLDESNEDTPVVSLFIHFYESTMQMSAKDKIFDTAKVGRIMSKYIIDNIKLVKKSVAANN
ncbi:hypothetical protein NC796_14270 [Aliifodinibius sp. S!AR15-10]|uniref:hypothetical protein n=1 Tax=Aliifodinibius sp. S!AR15-10 TaxID=2950437 RepID=UPI002856F621|nr:hypothetical protein [Aliifodinibius sp. S!AR15-10]MDR8392315.1 hypothetical protein [Aliifodinibius sp. S!AR15-10]